MRTTYLWPLLALMGLSACWPSSTDDHQLLASFGNEKLYLEDIALQLPPAGSMPEADSTAFVSSVIREWARTRVLVEAAEFNLTKEDLNVQELVTQYRNDLLKHAYIERYVAQHMDTSLTREEIQSYYEEHKASFELKESILQGHYLAAPVRAQNVEDAKAWFKKSGRDEDKFLEWAEVYANKQSLFADSSWVPMSEFLQQIPLETTNPYSFFSRNERFTCEDTSMVYFVKVKEVRIENSYSPLEYVESRIRKVLLNKKRLSLIAEMEENIVNDAIEEGKLVIH